MCLINLYTINNMDVQLGDFKDGQPLVVKTSKEIAEKIQKFRKNKQYKELLELANTLPNNKDKYILKTNSLLHLKNWKQLISDCDKGLELCEQSQGAEFLNLKGKALGKLGYYQQKAAMIQKAIDIDPKIPAYHRNLGAAFYKLKQYENAIKQHNNAIEIQPKNSINYHNRGAAQFRAQKYQDALESLTKAIQLDEKQAISYAWLADTQKQLGKLKQAKENYNKAYSLTDQEHYKQQAKQLDKLINPNQKKGFFAKIFG